ncbi:hypothetical protein LXA43DRAFT_311304 [Ganoderma leucocontextum]|nr:hypothetical protein LXA43DRAFT_311304 [Ganoderma leucocontextum]
MAVFRSLPPKHLKALSTLLVPSDNPAIPHPALMHPDDNATALRELPVEACAEPPKPRHPGSSFRPAASPTLAEYPKPLPPGPVPKLRTLLSDDVFPSDLLVHDTRNLTGRTTSRPIRYARVYPILPQDTNSHPNGKHGRTSKLQGRPRRNLAHLFLGAAVELDCGRRTATYLAPLTLPYHGTDRTFSLIAKLAHGICGAHQRLLQEAELFDGICRLLEGDVFDIQADCAVKNSDPDSTTGSSPAGLPYFYGFYLPVRKNKSTRVRAHGGGCNENCEQEVLWTTPILLLEECDDSVVAE